MTEDIQKKQDSPEDQIRQLQKEKKRLQRKLKRYETQLKQLDKMAGANEKININLNKELESLSRELETNNRELEIEAALERVRARAMAMHESEELAEAASVLFQQLQGLGVLALRRCFIDIIDEVASTIQPWYTSMQGESSATSFTIPAGGHFVNKRIIKGWKKGKAFSFELSGAELTDYIRHLLEHGFVYPKGETPPERVIISLFPFSHGLLVLITYEPLAREDFEVLRRFARVFEQTYTRFLDLKQAEAQAREAQIEAALERIRAKTMAMRQSNELSDACTVLFEQAKILGFPISRCGFEIIDNEKATWTTWRCSLKGELIDESLSVPLSKAAKLLPKGLRSWNNKDDFWTDEMQGRDLKKFVNALTTMSGKLMNDYESVSLSEGDSVFLNIFWHKHGGLTINTSTPLTDELIEVGKRFARVFEQTYTRFLDLQKAEAQAREAQIEAALERVRARAMAMHHSDELAETAVVVFEQLQGLGLKPWRCGFGIIDDAEKSMTFWSTTAEGDEIAKAAGVVPLHEHPVFQEIYRVWKAQEPFYDVEVSEIRSFVQYLLERTTLRYPEWEAGLPEDFPASMVMCGVPFTHGCLQFNTLERPSPAQFDILQRFAKVFDMTYRRFLDLKQAEEQAREAQIEAALERVRAKAMAMHNSTDLSDATAIVFSELEKLGIITLRCGITIIHETKQMDVWTATATAEEQDVRVIGRLDMTIHPALEGAFEAWKKQQRFYSYEFAGKDLQNYYKAIEKAPDYPIPEQDLSMPKQFVSTFNFPEGALFAFTEEPLSEETIRIFKRFASVFALTYRRYLDLKQAEEQAREAQIEAALERIRARTMAMHQSDEFAETAGVLFEQMTGLGIVPQRCIIGIIDSATARCKVWYTSSNGEVVPGSDSVPLTEQENFIAMFDAWKNKEQLHTFELVGEARVAWTRYMMEKANMHLPEYQPDKIDRQQLLTEPAVFNSFFFSHGLVMLHTTDHLTEADVAMLKRFARVFEQTYTRFLDLQQAEARAREAEQQASLDRVRAEIASMRTAADLQRITPLIWRELTTLGVPFFRCGVFIIDEASEKAHVYLSTPKGKSLAVMHMDFDSTSLVAQTVEQWRQKKIYREEWDKKQFIEWTQSLIEQGLIDSPEKYRAGEEPPEKLVLQFVPFTQGMLYVGSAALLSDDEIALTKTLADTFAVAYARYEDFQRLEAAKAEVEAALENLKKTQNQLVQSEKMASLGQLTAGIAHEIKNPLNFVNNFAELSGELLEELREEIEKLKSQNGNREEIEDLLNDLQQNAQKINEHGKRADSIVKGMLQHSRGGKGERQPTDLNAMLEEDLNLAYHGMRAQDSSFNVTMEKQFETNLPKVDVVPQNISRVFLNIITNGFHAVHERNQKSANDFSPKLQVQTRLDGDTVVIRIKDNGSGIPADIRENIFQPFFTTKPTGQGTGLGLSISYDIVVQEHHGEIRVDSKEGEFTEFIVTLPVKKSR